MSFILNRVGQTLLVLIATAFVSFVIVRYVGDPVNNMVGQSATVEARERMRQELGLDDPIPTQFLRFCGDALSGNFGVSYRYGQSVTSLIKERLPASLELSLCAMLIAAGIGVPLGVWSAANPGSIAARAALGLSVIGIALPTFVVGIVLILVFSVWLGWLPAFGRGEVRDLGGWTTGLVTLSGIKALVLPSLTLGLFQMTLIMRLVRAVVLDILHSDFVRFAKARGLPLRRVYYVHVLGNALLPVITIVALQFGNLFAFSVVVETVFQWPGLGLLIIQAIQYADIPVLAVYLVMISGFFALLNFLVDLTSFAIDPRLRDGASVSVAT